MGLKVNYIYILCLTLIVSSCIDDFDKLTDSEYQSISVEIDPSGWYDDILDIAQDDFEKHRIYISTDNEHSIRITGLCYDNKDSLLSISEVLTKEISPTSLNFTRVSCNEYCHLVIFADLVKNETNTKDYEENWVYLNRDIYNDLTVLSLGSADHHSYRSLYMGYINAVPKNQLLKVNMNKVSNNGYIKIINRVSSKDFHGSMKYPNRFLAKTQTNTTLQSQEFSTPYGFSGELIFPITTINYGNEVRISYSADYSYSNVESNTFVVNIESNKNFLLTADCTFGSANPINLKTY